MESCPKICFVETDKIESFNHGSSYGKAGNSRSKGLGFNPLLDPIRLCFKIYSKFVSYILGV